MTEQRKRLIRSRKSGSEDLPLEPTPTVPQNIPQQPPPPTPKSKRDILFADDTQTCTVSLDDIKLGQIRVYADGETEPQTIKLPKSVALALRMAYREGLNTTARPQIITSKQTKEEELVIRAAESIADYLRRLGHCHGKIEQDLLDAVKILRESRRRPPDLLR